MAFVNLPTFTARQILTAALLNQIVAAMQGFATQTADISWPLIAGGNIDMDNQYTIDNMRTLWNVVNADEYDSPKLTNALAAVSGGGCVFIPPNTTIDGTTGATIASSNIWIIGCGTSSIIDLTSGAGPLLDTDNNLSNIGLMNLQLKESSATSGADGVIFRRTTGPALINVLFTSFDGDSVYYTNDGTPGNSCADAMLSGVQFAGGGANGNHIKADDLDGLFMDHVLSKTAGADAVAMEPAAANSIIRDIQMGSNVRIESPTGKGISILAGTTAVGPPPVGDAKWGRISLTGPVVVSPTGDGFEIGETAKILQDVNLLGCRVLSPGADAFVVNAEKGSVIGCYGPGAIGDGLDLVESEDVLVDGCHFQDAGANGVDASGTTDCTVINTNVRDATTEGVRRDGATGLVTGNNEGDISTSISTAHTAGATSITGTGEVTAMTYTIPADKLSKSGDGFRIVVGTNVGASANMTLRVKSGFLSKHW
jgi:hypothetical protein